MTGAIGPALVDLIPRLRRFAIGLSRSREAADDLVQAALERALGGAVPEGEVRLDAWMFRVLRNLWIDSIRRRQTRGTEIDIDAPRLAGLPEIDQVAAIERRDLLRRTASALDDLPEEQREVVVLVCVEELSYAEAADILGCPIGTVMSRLARARRRLIEATGAAGERI